MAPAPTLLQQQLVVDPNTAQQHTTLAIQGSDGSLIPVQLATSTNGGPILMVMTNAQQQAVQQTLYTTQALGSTATTVDGASLLGATAAAGAGGATGAEDEAQLLQTQEPLVRPLSSWYNRPRPLVN